MQANISFLEVRVSGRMIGIKPRLKLDVLSVLSERNSATTESSGQFRKRLFHI